MIFVEHSSKNKVTKKPHSMVIFRIKVLVVENHSDGCPENIFRIWNTLLLVQSTFDIQMDATVG